MGFHTNFNPDTGDPTEPGWKDKEVILICLFKDIEKRKGADVSIICSQNKTEVFMLNNLSLSLDGNLLSQCGKDALYSVLFLEVQDFDKFEEMSKSFFKKNIGDFKSEESLLGNWFDYSKRSEILVERAFREMINSGLYSHLIPLIYMPFTKDVFQYGKLDSDSPSIFSRVKKETIKVKEKGA